MALPKYTAQLRDQLKLQRSQVILRAIVVTILPPIILKFIVEDQRVYDEVIKPFAKYFYYYVIIVWALSLLHVSFLSMRINNLTDSSEN